MAGPGSEIMSRARSSYVFCTSVFCILYSVHTDHTHGNVNVTGGVEVEMTLGAGRVWLVANVETTQWRGCLVSLAPSPEEYWDVLGHGQAPTHRSA